MVKCVSILGSTGSIGRQSLDIVKHLGLSVAALTAGTSVARMVQQCREFLPKLAVMSTQAAAVQLAEDTRAVGQKEAAIMRNILENGTYVRPWVDDLLKKINCEIL